MKIFERKQSPVPSLILATIGVALIIGFSSCGAPGTLPPLPAQGGTAPATMPSTGPSGSPAPAAAPTFTQISTNILQPNCVSCHNSSSQSGGVDLSSYAGVSAVVVPGNPSGSRLYQAVSSHAMPPGGSLSDADVQSIGAWITAGAPNN